MNIYNRRKMTVEFSNNEKDEISLYEQRDLLKLLIILEDVDMEKRERWVKRLSTVKQNIKDMQWIDNPEKYI